MLSLLPCQPSHIHSSNCPHHTADHTGGWLGIPPPTNAAMQNRRAAARPHIVCCAIDASPACQCCSSSAQRHKCSSRSRSSSLDSCSAGVLQACSCDSSRTYQHGLGWQHAQSVSQPVLPQQVSKEGGRGSQRLLLTEHSTLSRAVALRVCAGNGMQSWTPAVTAAASTQAFFSIHS